MNKFRKKLLICLCLYLIFCACTLAYGAPPQVSQTQETWLEWGKRKATTFKNKAILFAAQAYREDKKLKDTRAYQSSFLGQLTGSVLSSTLTTTKAPHCQSDAGMILAPSKVPFLFGSLVTLAVQHAALPFMSHACHRFLPGRWARRFDSGLQAGLLLLRVYSYYTNTLQALGIDVCGGLSIVGLRAAAKALGLKPHKELEGFVYFVTRSLGAGLLARDYPQTAPETSPPKRLTFAHAAPVNAYPVDLEIAPRKDLTFAQAVALDPYEELPEGVIPGCWNETLVAQAQRHFRTNILPLLKETFHNATKDGKHVALLIGEDHYSCMSYLLEIYTLGYLSRHWAMKTALDEGSPQYLDIEIGSAKEMAMSHVPFPIAEKGRDKFLKLAHFMGQGIEVIPLESIWYRFYDYFWTDKQYIKRLQSIIEAYKSSHQPLEKCENFCAKTRPPICPYIETPDPLCPNLPFRDEHMGKSIRRMLKRKTPQHFANLMGEEHVAGVLYYVHPEDFPHYAFLAISTHPHPSRKSLEAYDKMYNLDVILEFAKTVVGEQCYKELINYRQRRLDFHRSPPRSHIVVEEEDF